MRYNEHINSIHFLRNVPNNSISMTTCLVPLTFRMKTGRSTTKLSKSSTSTFNTQERYLRESSLQQTRSARRRDGRGIHNCALRTRENHTVRLQGGATGRDAPRQACSGDSGQSAVGQASNGGQANIRKRQEDDSSTRGCQRTPSRATRR